MKTKFFVVLKMNEKLIENGLLFITLILTLIIGLMLFFLISQSMPAFGQIGFQEMLAGLKWLPDMEIFGTFPMILSTLTVSFLALMIAVPLSLTTAIYIEEIASDYVKELFKPIIQTLAGIPSVVYGFFGLTVLVPLIRENLGGTGFSILTASIVLAIMILPTIISLSQDAISNVAFDYRQASLALGSSHFQTIRHIIIPCALPGIFTGIILGLGRAVGETLAVLMIVGNVAQIPNSLIDPVRTLASNIALEMGYAMDIHYNALFASALILFAIIIVLMLISTYIQHKWGC
ncbi:phosphate ABC transporter permease subunit PstC [Methanobrevibacter millerae]|nr:phosphate ABC transporter permease subunit PstC [Methanobrevibacter millerae]